MKTSNGSGIRDPQFETMLSKDILTYNILKYILLYILKYILVYPSLYSIIILNKDI